MAKILFLKNNKNSNNSNNFKIKIKNNNLIKKYYFKYFKKFYLTITKLLKGIKKPNYFYIIILTLFKIFIKTKLYSINYKSYY